MAGTAWTITAEERAKHDAQFFTLKPVNGFITGEQAKGFFLQSGLQPAVLGQIWSLADMNCDGKMDKKEFSIAMHLIKKKLQGFELPKSLPASLKSDPSPVIGGFGGMSSGVSVMGSMPMAMSSMGMSGPMPPMGTMASTSMVASPMTMPLMTNGTNTAMGPSNFGSMTMPGMYMENKPRSGSFNAAPAPAAVHTARPGNFAMPHPSKLRYTQMFNSNDMGKRGFLTGVEARALLVQTGVPQNVLAQIWALSDIDRDGKLTCDEFCIAMHLTDLVRTGIVLPSSLPPELHPARSRSGSRDASSSPSHSAAPAPPQNDSFGDLLGTMGMPAPKPPATNGESGTEIVEEQAHVTFEDRRKENFAKGQAELERRRQLLQEQMRRETEERLEKERKEQEKREKIRQEQERKRLAELERQMEKQRQKEREIEEQRAKMMEQREAARRESERQRQMEWERQRKEQLLSEKRREYEQLGVIKARESDLSCELESQGGKKTELSQKIDQVGTGVKEHTRSIESMRETRDKKMSEIEVLQNELSALELNHQQLQEARQHLEITAQTVIQNNPLSETHRAVLHSVESKKSSIEKLKKDLEKIEKNTESTLEQIDNSNLELEKLNKKMSDMQSEMASLQQQKSQKQAEVQKESASKQKAEKEKQDRLKKELETQRKREESQKEEAKPQQDAWFDFGSTDTKQSTTKQSGDIWSDAFSSENLKESSNDIWANAFASQTDKSSSNSAACGSSEGSGKFYQALYAFEAKNEDELTLNAGDVVEASKDQSSVEPGWMIGIKSGKKGWFPKDYVEEYTENKSSQFSDAFGGDSAATSAAIAPPASAITEIADELSGLPVSSSPTPGQGTSAPEGLQAIALYPWKAKKDNHLSFNKGDVINIQEQQDMWWSGEIHGQVGWFPKSYVKLKSSTTTNSLASSRADTPNTLNDINIQPTPNLPAVSVEPSPELHVAMYTYSSTEPGDLTFEAGEVITVTKKDGDWWTGNIDNRNGIFPANYVKQAEQQQAAPKAPVSNISTLNAVPASSGAGSSQSLKKPEIASVIAAYSATGPEQLSLSPGQLIQVRKKSPSGWWEGELQARGQKRKIGWFPANYVKLLGSSSCRSTPDAGGSSQRDSPLLSSINRTNTPTIPVPQAPVVEASSSQYVDQVVALFPYQAQNSDELTFHNGSVINVISKDDANWWSGECNGQTGVFPSNYVGPLSSDQEPSWSSDPSVLAETSPLETKRQIHIHELIMTELTYMEDMSVVVDAFYKPLAESKVLNSEELSAIFVNWNELILCNTKLSKSFKVRQRTCGKGKVIHVIGDILCENIPHMTPYIRFCSVQLNAAALLQHKTETSPEFKEVHKKCVTNPKTKGMPLSSFLLKPMQRITKYPLLIEKILQYTPEGHPDREYLIEAMGKVKELCNQVNEGVRQRENSDQLEWIQNHVVYEGLSEKITFNSLTNCLGQRKLIKYGTLFKTKGNKELVAFLFNDFLFLTLPLSSSWSLFDSKSKSKFRMYKKPIFLNEVMMNRSPEAEDNLTFQVRHIDRIYHFRATSQNEKESWIKNLETASKNYLDTEKKKLEKSHSSAHKTHIVGRLLVILVEGINLASTEDVKKTGGVGRLLVIILEGCDLQASDDNGKSDPFCEVTMGAQEHKTKVIQATLNPKWNQSMQFMIRDVQQDVLCITVFDRDLFTPNDFLGRTEIRIKEIMDETRKMLGPITKRLLLHEVSSGEVVVKLDLQLFDST